MSQKGLWKGFFLLIVILGTAACSPKIEKPEITSTAGTSAVIVQSTTTPTTVIPPTSTTTSTPTPFPEPTETPITSSVSVAFGPEDFPSDINPLTGLQVSDPAILQRNPILVKVSNFPRGLRPHSGLSAADMVFEYTIGEGSTRFTALYYGQNAEIVGPVRSARLIDASIGKAYQGILAFASADAYVYNWVLNALGSRAVTEGPATCPALCRTGTGDVNSVFANTALLTDYVTKERKLPAVSPSLNGMSFDTNIPAGGSDGGWLLVQYSFYARSEWHFDAGTGRYLRWIESVDSQNNVTMEPLVDRTTDKQLAFNNVVVLFAQHNELKPTLHEIVILGNTSGLPFMLFRDGKVYQGTWKGTGNDEPIQFFTKEGILLPFKPGNTWFEVVGVSSAIDEVKSGEWQVNFFIP